MEATEIKIPINVESVREATEALERLADAATKANEAIQKLKGPSIGISKESVSRAVQEALEHERQPGGLLSL